VAFLRDLAGGSLAFASSAGDLAGAARDAAVAAGLLPAAVGVDGYLDLQRVHEHNSALLAAHVPGCWEGPALLLVAGRVDGRPDPAAGWRRLCSRLEVEVWPHDHHSIIRDGAAIADRVVAWARAVNEEVRT
jgi:hypothetical protein